MANQEEPTPFIIQPKMKILKVDSFEDMHISQASVASLMPKGFKAEMNVDILPVVFNLAKVNEINENGDAMNALAAIKSVKSFANKPINVEHERRQIVGHIVNASLSENEFDFNDNNLSSFSDKTTPFYINAVGFIYAKIFPDLAQAIIDAANEENEEYKTISTSWELAFKKFKIVKSSSKNLADATYINEDDYEQYRKYVKRFGGKGVDAEGNIVGRVVYGESIGLGAGLTMQPAADVQGVYLVQDIFNEQLEDKSVAKKQKNSQSTQNDVRTIKSNILNMDENETKEFLEKMTEAVASVVRKESDAKSIGQIFHEAIKEHGENWKSKVEAEAQARAEADQKLATLSSEYEKIQSELSQMKEQMEAKASADLFNDRMNFFDTEYELTEQENEIIASELKQVGNTEEAFASYKEKIGVLFSHKSKAAIAKAKEEEEARIEQAIAQRLEKTNSTQEATASQVTSSQETSEEEELETETAQANLPNSNGESSQTKTLLEKAKESFKVTIS